jgi:hypothetical protein
MAVAPQRDQCRAILLAVEIGDEPRDAAQYPWAAKGSAKHTAERLHADVDRHMLLEQLRRDAEVDIGGNMVRGMIGDQQQASGGVARNVDPGFAHARLLPPGARAVTTHLEKFGGFMKRGGRPMARRPRCQ